MEWLEILVQNLLDNVIPIIICVLNAILTLFKTRKSAVNKKVDLSQYHVKLAKRTIKLSELQELGLLEKENKRKE